MSCVGKTTFANTMKNHNYLCFDYLFDWSSTETLGLPIDSSLKGIACIAENYDCYVLDGWHLADFEGKLLPKGCTIYVVYSKYERIISQYRTPVRHPEEHRCMFDKWYNRVPYSDFPRVRYILNVGSFVETDYTEFLEIIS